MDWIFLGPEKITYNVDIRLIIYVIRYMRGSKPAIRKKTIEFLIRRDGGYCCYCQKNFEDFQSVTLDHMVPRCNGGTMSIFNLALACKQCNNMRQNNDFLKSLNNCGIRHETIDKYQKYIKTYSQIRFLQNFIENIKLSELNSEKNKLIKDLGRCISPYLLKNQTIKFPSTGR